MRKEDGRIVGRLRAASKAIVTSPVAVGDVVSPVAVGDVVFIQGQGGTLGAFRAGS